MLWVEKYRPKTIEDVVAGKKIIESILEWAERWKKGEREKPLLLAGPPGIGKTSIALALANTFGWEVVELNASDQRNWQIINKIVGEGVLSETLSEGGDFFSTSRSKFKLIILDEVDNIHGREDYGGESALAKIIKKKPAQPMILIANEPYKLSPGLRNLCKTVFFRRLTSKQIAAILSKICKKEGIEADKEVLIAIAENAGGDLRAAINDLQAVAEMKKKIGIDDIVVGKRTQETDIFRVIQKIFKKLDPSAYSEAGLLDETPDDLIMWIDENIPLEYHGEKLFKGYLTLSTADIFLGRVRRRQYYRLWRYASYLMTTGIQYIK
ncbi:MAG TPA: replication factor C large subunit, partial [Archaeoglobaceae archaeon]|nr:replication factor C large subunit [Archaeoglobaceae archaeon]